MGTIKDTNGMDWTEADDIKKRWQEYTELCKNDLHASSISKKQNHQYLVSPWPGSILLREDKGT